MDLKNNISRRDFLKLSGLAAGALLLPLDRVSAATPMQEIWTPGANLGRVAMGAYRSFIDLKAEPNMNAANTTRVCVTMF